LVSDRLNRRTLVIIVFRRVPTSPLLANIAMTVAPHANWFRFSLSTLLLVFFATSVVLTLSLKFYLRTQEVPTVSLTTLVTRFNNTEAWNHPIGQHEPPLTEDEVLAAIRAQLPSMSSHPEAQAIFAEILRTGQIPEVYLVNPLYPNAPLHDLKAIPGWSPGGATSFTTWWINFNVLVPGGNGYGLRIRENNHPHAKPAEEPRLNRPNILFGPAAQSQEPDAAAVE